MAEHDEGPDEWEFDDGGYVEDDEPMTEEEALIYGDAQGHRPYARRHEPDDVPPQRCWTCDGSGMDLWEHGRWVTCSECGGMGFVT